MRTMITPQYIVRRIVHPHATPSRESVTCFAPANIALCKYWGKRDTILNLPVTDSLSLSLGDLGSRCHLRFCEKRDQVSLNGEELSHLHPFVKRVSNYLDLFRQDRQAFYRVEAVNTIPTAAGFASSASGFAALVMALDALHGWELNASDQSILARLGSGSACRSLWQGFVHWQAGTRPDGMDSFGVPLTDATWPELRIGLVMIDRAPKPIGSTEAMLRTVETSTLYGSWPTKVGQDMSELLQAIATRDFDRLGSTAESNALTMHATMLAACPPVLYWNSASLNAMQSVWQARKDGIPVYFTMDAGPNLKLLFPESAHTSVESRFPELVTAGAKAEDASP